MKIEAGCIVQRTGGGPYMTVTTVVGAGAECVWILPRLGFRRETIPVHDLVIVDRLQAQPAGQS